MIICPINNPIAMQKTAANIQKPEKPTTGKRSALPTVIAAIFQVDIDKD